MKGTYVEQQRRIRKDVNATGAEAKPAGRVDHDKHDKVGDGGDDGAHSSPHGPDCQAAELAVLELVLEERHDEHCQKIEVDEHVEGHEGDQSPPLPAECAHSVGAQGIDAAGLEKDEDGEPAEHEEEVEAVVP